MTKKKVIVIASCLCLALTLLACDVNSIADETKATVPEETIVQTMPSEEQEEIVTEQEKEPTDIEADEPDGTESQEMASHEHSYKEDVVDPTCVKGGLITYTCECGDTYSEAIAVAEHKYETNTIKPTYSSKGYDNHVCSVCGDEYKDNYTDVVPHDHDYDKSVVKPTCTSGGYSTYTCSLCGKAYQDDKTSALGHSYTTKTIDPTYTKKGYDEHVCTRCKHSYKDNYKDVVPHEHKYNQVITAPTCTKKGYTTNTCSLCGKSYQSDETDMIPHKYTSKVTAPTCTAGGYTTYTCGCGKSYKSDETNKIAHDYETNVIKPTCTEKGYTANKCSMCGAGENSDYTDALGHDYVTKTVAPTAKEKGYDAHTCSRCGDTYKDNYTEPVVTYTEVNETVYAKSDVNIRKGPSTDYDKIGSLAAGKSITRVGIGDNGWSKVMYNDEVAYIHSDYLTTEKPPVVSANGYPKTYSDSTCTITITKEWHENAWCYIAHLKFSDYSRLSSAVAKNSLGSYETTSAAAKRLGAIFCVNGPYMSGSGDSSSYAIIRNGKVFKDAAIGSDFGIYNSATGKLMSASAVGVSGMMASEAVAQGLATDTFKFYNSTLVTNGSNVANPNNNDRAQRTFVGTTGKAGELYIVVSEGRYADGKSPGLRKYECASLLVKLGCTYGVMLDGGGSSTMYFNGKVLNSASGGQRSVVDFVYFK